MKLFKLTLQPSHVGMFYLLLSALLFTISDAFIKDGVQRFSINQILFFRYVFSLFPSIMFLYYEKGFKGFKLIQAPLLIVLAFASVFSLSCIFYIFAHIPFADAMVINFSSIFFALFIAIPILKEWPSFSQLLAAFIGFIGVVLIVQPSEKIINFVGVMSFLWMLGDGLAIVIGRFLTLKSVSCSTMSFYFTIISVILTAVTLPFSFIMPSRGDFFLLIIIGITAGIAQYWCFKGFSLTPPAIGAPMNYSAVVWSSLWGYLFWGESPETKAFFGAGLILIAAFYLAYHESQECRSNILLISK